MIPIALEHAFEIRIEVAKPVEIGDVGMGDRRVIDITGGSIAGPTGKGLVRPGGADYQIIRPNGLTILHARYTLEMEDGTLIYIENDGIRFGPAEALAKIRRGEPVDPALIYFRCAPRFETASPRYRWMMEHVFVGSGARRPDAVEISIYKVV